MVFAGSKQKQGVCVMSKFSIKQEVSFLAILSIAGIAILIVIQMIGNEKIHFLYKLNADINHVEANMLMLRRNEKDFLARNDLKYVDKFNANYLSLLNDVKKLVSDYKNAGLSELTNHGNNFIAVLKDYNSKFIQLKDVRIQIGLDPKSGLYGALRESVHNAEAQIYKIGDYKLARDMLMLRRREKDFMLRYDTKYVEKFDKDLIAFNKTLQESFISESIRDQIKNHMVAYDRDFKELVKANIKVGLSSSDGLIGEMRSTIHKSEEQLAAFKKNAIKEVDAAISSQLIIRGIITSVICLVLIVIGILIIRSITSPINKFSKLMSLSAKDLDLTQTANENAPKEVASMSCAFNYMIKEFQSAITQITKISDELNSASVTLDSVSVSVKDIVNKQLTESEKVATAMNEMTTTTQDISLNASSAASTVDSANTQALQGKGVVVENQLEIETLAQNVNDAATVIGDLSKESENIGTVLNVIREIAEQTNLLALNAAIEAARAGDQGRGFAVVADEVRTLAQRSQESTEEIKAIVERLQSTAGKAVQAMETGKEQAQKSVERSRVVSDILDGINDAISSIKDMNFQVATASEEQSAVAEEINRNVVNITEITKDTSNNTNQVVQLGKSLSDAARRIAELMKKFKV